MIKLNDKSLDVLTYPNGETAVKLPDDVLKSSSNILLEWDWDITGNGDKGIWTLLQVADTLNNFGNNKKVTLYIPYLPYERMDRAQHNNPFSLNILVNLIPQDWEVLSLEVHSSVASKLFKKRGIKFTNSIITSDILKMLLTEQKALENTDTSLIVFPDEGSVKRYKSSLRVKNGKVGFPYDCNYIVGEKTRDFDTGKIKSYDFVDSQGNKLNIAKDIDKEYQNIYIVDDVVSYGGTFILASQQLKKLYPNAKITLIVAHAENGSSNLKNSNIDTFIFTDTINNLMDTDSFKVGNKNKTQYMTLSDIKHGTEERVYVVDLNKIKNTKEDK